MKTHDARPEAILARILAAGGSRLAEPAEGYDCQIEGGTLVLRSENVKVEFVNLSSEGQGNAIVLGLAAQAPKMKALRLAGEGNILFLGPHSYMAGLDVDVSGNGNLIYFGAFSTAGQVNVRIRGDGKTVRIGDFCMLSNRIFLGLDDEIGIFDAASGAALPRGGDVLVDDRVWIGRDVVLRNGTVIEPDCVVGQGSVAQGHLLAGRVYGGAPARVLREDIRWSRTKDGSIAELEASKRQEWNIKRMRAVEARIAALRGQA